MKGEIIFFSSHLALAFPAKKINDHCFSKTGDSWSDTVSKTMTLVLIFSGSPNSESKNDNWAQRGWNHSHHYIRTKTLKTEPETPRSIMVSRTPRHKGKLKWGMVSTIPCKGVVMETLIGEQVIGFWKLIKAQLDGEKEVKKDMKSDTEDRVELRSHCGNERTHHYYKTGHGRLERPICPARMPMSQCARICLLWHHSSHDSACRTMW